MREPFIFLCPEITRENAYTLIEWMRSGEVRQYLSDTHDVSDEIERMLDRVNLPVLTHLFNQNGIFYMAYDKNKKNSPVGFVRLAAKSDEKETEIVVVIGDSKNWGKRLGSGVIHESLKIAFYELRFRRIVAKIHMENIRSIRAFSKAGFTLASRNGRYIEYTLSLNEYLNKNNKNAAEQADLHITAIDCERLRKLINEVTYEEVKISKSVRELDEELNKANIVDPKQISEKTVTMNSKVLLCLDGDEKPVTLVYPKEADYFENKISVLSPIGIAILGYGEGNVINWEVPAGLIEIHIKKVLYQPEAAGHYHL